MAKDLVILDCTIRDGNYAVDFKFTESDTRLVTRHLSTLGIPWIEVGHGLGLGAQDAGKGKMVASDWDLIRAAKEEVIKSGRDAKIGMFMIPAFAKAELLQEAQEAGLDFIRIGENAPEVEKVFPVVEYARKLGLLPCVNLMKTYGISPKTFAEKARAASNAGAEVVYGVDSAGSMMPNDIRRYFDEASKVATCDLGFHGHNNLMMVISNCLAAYESGARYIDTTLCGVGRSAGNAPTEILVAVLEKLGIQTHVDLFALLDMIESVMWPLVGKTRPHDMMGVAAGYSQFHSSFLPKVAKKAKEYRAELKRLVAKIALHDPVSLDEKFLESAAKDLEGTDRRLEGESLIAFHDEGFHALSIRRSLASVPALIQGLEATAAKRSGSRVVLHLQQAEGEIISEFVMADANIVVGRVQYESISDLSEILSLTKSTVFMYLLSAEGDKQEALRLLKSHVGPARVAPVRQADLRRQFLTEILERTALQTGGESLLLFSPTEELLAQLGKSSAFRSRFILDSQQPRDEFISLSSKSDWKELKLQFSTILCEGSPSREDLQSLLHVLAPEGRLLSLRSKSFFPDCDDPRIVFVDFNLAFAGIVSQHLAVNSLFGMETGVRIEVGL